MRTTRFLLLLLMMLPVRAADIAVSGLPTITSPSDNSYLYLVDLNAAQQSRKYHLTNLVRQFQIDTSAEMLALLNNAHVTDLSDGTLTGSKVGTGIDDDNVDFDDADNLWTATTLGAALEELNNSINAGAANGTGAKVHWSQLLGVPAGLADGTDDGGGGGTTGTMINTGASTATAVPKYSDTTGTNLVPSSVLIDASNNLFVGDGTSTVPAFGWTSDNDGSGTGLYRRTANAVTTAINGTGHFEVNASGVSMSSAWVLGWSSGALSTTRDTILLREAANTLALRNGTSAQTLNITKTFTDASNYERMSLTTTSGNYDISLDKAGTGASRNFRITGAGVASIMFNTANSGRWEINSSGHLLAQVDNSYDIGASGATRPRNLFIAGDMNHGGATMVMSATGKYTWSGRTQISAPSNGSVLMWNNVNNDFGLLQFGGTSSSYPALKRSTTGLIVRLADDSADAPVTASTVTASTSMTLGGVTRTSWPSGAATNSFPLPIKPTFLPSSNAAREDTGADNFRLRFAQNQAAIWQFALPRNYNGGMHIDLTWEMDTATSGSVTWSVEVWALSAGDAADNGTQSFDTANTASTTVPGVAGRPGITTVTCANADSAAALDFVQLRLTRTDAVSGDADLTGILFNHAMP